jgi:hypothetical protein
MFAAGFQDHAIGPILGTSENTGAGGANVWSHALLRQLMETEDPAALPSPYRTLPHAADLRVAIRRTVRVGANAGVVVEDLGIKPDHIHRMTRKDLLGNNDDLIAAAIGLLAGKKPHAIRVHVLPNDGELPRLQVETHNVTRLDVYFNDRPRASRDIHHAQVEIDLPALIGAPEPGRRSLELRGYEGDELVVVFRSELE